MNNLATSAVRRKFSLRSILEKVRTVPEIKKYTSEGPFTAAFSKAAPPRIGYWIGWQIVRQYMNNNPEVTMQQLMDNNDAQQLLAKSKYKPKK